MPLAAYATWQGDQLHIDAAWGDAEQPAPLVTASAQAAITDLASATALGEQVAAQLRAGGAR